MSNTATLERVENVQVQEFVAVRSAKLSLDDAARATAQCMAIFLAAFTVGIFVCKGIIYSQMVHGIQIENLFVANVGATVILSSLIMYCGKKGLIKQAAALGAFGAMLSGAVAYAVACVVFAG